MKLNYFNDLEFNCIQVAIDHLRDDLADVLIDHYFKAKPVMMFLREALGLA